MTLVALGAVPAQAAEAFCSATFGTCWAGPVNANSSAHYIVIYGWSDACATVDAYDYDNGRHVGETLVACGGTKEQTIHGLYGRYRVRVNGTLGYTRTGGLRNVCPCDT